ncbi:DUF1707 and DUF4870 domain-containing protein [Microlunatus soli]|uniref:DUF1707 domain-containing protein n=1 Tax=Microlunatus soli TaxID=630515 RepID=A0A1H1Z8V3_9ACTN|nr:DUF1707 and DUF4870 domain-containing protein [Microlunatus soli]SDT30090.1 protein of unknown function [Microlunatus soli]
MSASFEHPSLRTPVTTEQRDRAAEHLQTAYAEGRITEDEFERRIGQVLGAQNRKELNDAFYGLVEVPPATTSYSPATYGTAPYGGQSNYPARRQEGSTGGALAHFSGLFTGMIIGPGIGYAISKPGSQTRKEAAKAFNFQLISLIGLIVGGTLAAVTDWGIINFLVGLGSLAWFILTIVGGVKAAQGEDWTNPVKKVIKLDVLPEK